MPEGMNEHGHASADIAQEHYSRQVAEDVLGRWSKTRAQLALAIVSLLTLRARQRLPTRSLDSGLDEVFVLL